MYADKYAPDLPPSYKQFIADLHKQELDPSINLVLERVFDYDKTGRYQTEQEALQFDTDIRKVLVTNSVRYCTLPPTDLIRMLEYITNL